MTFCAAADDDSVRRDRAGCELLAEALRAGNETRLRVTGTSMLPTVWPGDMLRVRPADGTPPDKGAIVLFLRDGRVFAHRVAACSENRVITRGDSVPQCDPPVGVSEILGVVSAIVRERGMEREARLLSLSQRLVAFAAARSHLALRLALKVHRILRSNRLKAHPTQTMTEHANRGSESLPPKTDIAAQV